MKKFTGVIFVILMCSVLFGCGNSNVQKKSVKETETLNLGDKNTYSVLKSVDYDSTIPTETDRVQASLAIDNEVQSALKSGSYKFNSLKDSDIIVNAYGNSPLTALALFTTEQNCKVKVTVKGDSKDTDVSGSVDELTTEHRVPIIGLYANRTNKVIIQLLDKDNKEISSKTFNVKTDPLPTTLDNAITVYKHQKKSAYGLIEVSGFGTPYIYAFDEEGNIRWYLNEKYGCYGYYPLSNGHFMWMDGDDMIQTAEKPHSQNMYETDYLGRVYQIYYVKKGLHHEIIEKTKGGNLLVATSSLEGHFEETIQEIDRSNGQVVKTLTMDAIYGSTYVNKLDWAHINTISYNKQDDTVVVSTRNVHTVAKFNWSTNKIVWLMGDPSVWQNTDLKSFSLTPLNDNFIWQYQQHSAYQIATDLDNNPETVELGLYDNHWQKDAPIDTFQDEDGSYVKFYSINENDKTITQLHSYKGAKSRITSNWRADFNAGRVFAMSGYIADRKANDGQKGLIYEYDYDTEKVLNKYGSKYTFYRAYEIDLDLNACSKPLEVNDNYFCGTVNMATAEDNVKVPSDVLNSPDVNYSIVGNILKINAYDHAISKIEFVGKKHSYVHSFADTGDGEEKFKKLSYYLSTSFQNLEPDEYTVVITYYGDRTSTGQTITVK